MKKTAPKFHEEATRRAVAVRVSISPDDLSLIVNALRAKAAGDAQGARDVAEGARPNTAGAELARTLREQAEQGEQLADALEGVDVCEAIEVRS